MAGTCSSTSPDTPRTAATQRGAARQLSAAKRRTSSASNQGRVRQPMSVPPGVPDAAADRRPPAMTAPRWRFAGGAEDRDGDRRRHRAMRSDLPACRRIPTSCSAATPARRRLSAAGRCLRRPRRSTGRRGRARLDTVACWPAGPVYRGASPVRWVRATGTRSTASCSTGPVYPGWRQGGEGELRRPALDADEVARRVDATRAAAALPGTQPRSIARRLPRYVSRPPWTNCCGCSTGAESRPRNSARSRAPFQQLVDGDLSLVAAGTLREHTPTAWRRRSTEVGFTPSASGRPDPRGAACRRHLVSPRTAQEYGIESNGAGGAIDAGHGTGARPPAARRRPARGSTTGVYVGQLPLPELVGPQRCARHRMTRFATYWVEGGEIVAPLSVIALRRQPIPDARLRTGRHSTTKPTGSSTAAPTMAAQSNQPGSRRPAEAAAADPLADRDKRVGPPRRACAPRSSHWPAYFTAKQ